MGRVLRNDILVVWKTCAGFAEPWLAEPGFASEPCLLLWFAEQGLCSENLAPVRRTSFWFAEPHFGFAEPRLGSQNLASFKICKQIRFAEPRFGFAEPALGSQNLVSVRRTSVWFAEPHRTSLGSQNLGLGSQNHVWAHRTS